MKHPRSEVRRRELGTPWGQAFCVDKLLVALKFPSPQNPQCPPEPAGTPAQPDALLSGRPGCPGSDLAWAHIREHWPGSEGWLGTEMGDRDVDGEDAP